MNLAVIGVGRIGTIHARNLAFNIQSAELKAISDTRKDALEECAAKCGEPDTYKDYHDVLSRSDLDGVVICTSTNTHAQIIKDAAKAGKHVFCEKPIALDLDEIDEALEVVEEAGIKFQVGFSRRFDPSFRRAQKRVREGEIGQPNVLKITSRDPEPPPMDYVKASGGLFVDMTIHDFDMARFMMPGKVKEVYAHGSVLIDEDIGEVGDIDTAGVLIKFEDGAIGLIDNSRKASYGYDQRLEVLGSGGKIEVSNPRETQIEVSDVEGARQDPVLHFFTERYREAYENEMEAYTEFIRSGENSPASGEDGRMAVVLADAAEMSRKENRPVELDEID
ncbi:inositol 2-dehydrogenase [Candidatus Bipolaricaulota bacterium]|nr:inositol 2-dehydrogenase [Candidatus Bipolaricaulota bacterium]